VTQRIIVPFGDPILRKKAKPVEAMTAKIEKLLDDMAETLYGADNGAGLAAPQIGLLKRIVVMDCGDGLLELINPEIMEMSGEQYGSEACLSYPGYVGQVRRANKVKVSYRNRSWEPCTIEGHGFEARCLQHEIDHLNGVLFIDRMEEPVLIHETSGEYVNLIDVLHLANSK